MKGLISFIRNDQSEQFLSSNNSCHSDVKRGITRDGRVYLCKQYGTRAHGFDLLQAKTIVAHMSAFRRLADQIRIAVAPTLLVLYEPCEIAGRVFLLELQPYVGRDLQTVFSDKTISDEAVRSYIGDYLSLFKKVQDNGSHIALDPVLSNFCVNESGVSSDNTLVYVDMMPPRYRESEVVVSEWPTPPKKSINYIYRRYFGCEKSQVIYAKLLYALSERLEITADEIKEQIKQKLGEEAYTLISFRREEKKALLAEPEKYGPDVLRIIAAEGYRDGEYIRKQLYNTYRTTHIGVGGVLPLPEDMRKTAIDLQ